LDASLLAELLGKDGLRQLLDSDVIAATEADLQALSEERRATTVEQLFDLLRTAGPFSVPELEQRSAVGLDASAAVHQLVDSRRAVRVRIAGSDMVAVVEDVPRLRDGLGIPAPPGVAALADQRAEDPISDLVLRWARTHGPFTAVAVARRYGLGAFVVEAACERLTSAGTVVAGAFIEHENDGADTAEGRRQYCHAQVLALVKRRTLARLRREVEPVEQVSYARFLAEWQGVGATKATGVEAMIFPARVARYSPAMLDELTSTGEVFWVGDGTAGDSDGWVRFYPADMEPCPPRGEPGSARARALRNAFAPGGAYFFDALLRSIPDDGEPASSRSADVAALWDLVWAGLVTGDTFAPVRALISGGSRRAARRPMSRLHRSRPGQRPPSPRAAARSVSPSTVGRWSLVERQPDAGGAARLASQILAQLDRYGVLTRGSVMTEDAEGGFGAAYRALAALEESGQCRRGYFVEGLGAAQFALPGAVDRLRAAAGEPNDVTAQVLAATDPANPYGAALPWPDREGHRPGRKAGALVVTANGDLILYVERGGRTVLSFSEDPEHLSVAAGALGQAVHSGQLGKLTVERADGDHVFSSAAVSDALQSAGFRMTPQGLRLRPDTVG
jgi:ATP-dependent Lhr-like helicase